MSTNPFAPRVVAPEQEVDPRLEGEPEPITSLPQLISAAIAITLSFLSVALISAWLAHYREGFGLTGDARFNLHPLMMTLSIPFLLTCGILSWRTFPVSHASRKLLHATLNTSALALIAFGLYCVFTSQPPPYVYSPHSWMGLATALLLSLQALGGLVYLLPSGHGSIKAWLLAGHAWLGTVAWTLAMLTVCTGVMNLCGLLMTRGVHHYREGGEGHRVEGQRMELWSGENIVASVLGIVVFTILLTGLYAVMPRRAVIWEGEEETGEERMEGRERRLSSFTGSQYGTSVA